MTYSSETLTIRLKWVMFGRLLAGIMLIAAMIFIEVFSRGRELGGLGQLRYGPAYWTILGLCGLNLLYLILTRRGINLETLATVQLSLDVIVVGLLVYLTGIDRLFAFLYFAIVLISAHLLRPAMAFLYASGASIVLACVSLLHFFASTSAAGWALPFVDPTLVQEQEVRLNFLLPYLGSFAASLHITALLSFVIARELIRVRGMGQEVLENIAVGVFAIDREGHIIYVNRLACGLLGLAPEAFAGKVYANVVRRREIVDVLRDALISGERTVRETEISGRMHELTVTPIREPGRGGMRGVVGIFSDLTLRKKLENMTKLEERFGTFVELSAALAHEIRNPLASIKGASQELLEADSLQEDDRSLMSLLLREVNRLDRILTSFLDYAHPKPLELKICDVSKTVEEVVVLLEARARERDVQIEREIKPGIFCKADEDRLKQALLNIGINAIEAIHNSKGRIYVNCRGDTAGGAVVEVRDTGDGIRRDILNKVFDPFFSTKASGTGMGLAVARNVVRAHGGKITVESEVDQGTRCRIWLPS